MDSKITLGEGNLHIAVVETFRAHWKTHNNQKPQKLIMNPAQVRKFSQYQHPEYNPTGTYWGAPIESDPQSPGVMIAIDGTVMPFADYDKSAAKPE